MIAHILAVLVASALALPAAAQRAIPPVAPDVPPAADAPVALLVDLSSGQVLHSRNPDRRFAPASVTKVMTLYLAFDLMEEGRLHPAQVMEMTPALYRAWRRKGSNMRLDLGDRVLVNDLLMGIANVSANDGSAVLAAGHSGSIAAWTAAMNAKALEIGMTGSYFSTPNGWPDQGGTFTTANDLIVLGRALIARHPDKFVQYIGHQGYAFKGMPQTNHDPLLGKFPGADGIKTGFTNEAGFNYLGTAKRGNQRLMLVLAGVPYSPLRAKLARNYMEWGFSAFDRRRLFAAGEVVGHARVQNGAARKVALVADGPVEINLPEGYTGPVLARVVYDGPLRAPLPAGKQVAMLELSGPDIPEARIALMVRDAVDEAGTLDRLANGLAGWLPW